MYFEQIYLVTLVVMQNCTKMLTNVIFVVQIAFFFASDQIEERNKKKPFCLFEQLLLQKASFDFFWNNFLFVDIHEFW